LFRLGMMQWLLVSAVGAGTVVAFTALGALSGLVGERDSAAPTGRYGLLNYWTEVNEL